MPEIFKILMKIVIESALFRTRGLDQFQQFGFHKTNLSGLGEDVGYNGEFGHGSLCDDFTPNLK